MKKFKVPNTGRVTTVLWGLQLRNGELLCQRSGRAGIPVLAKSREACRDQKELFASIGFSGATPVRMVIDLSWSAIEKGKR